jgi:hypothetical protein
MTAYARAKGMLLRRPGTAQYLARSGHRPDDGISPRSIAVVTVAG